MVDAGEILRNIRSQRKAVTITVALVLLQCAVGTLSDAIGIGVGNKSALENRADDGVERVMHHPVTKRRGAYQSSLRVTHHKVNMLSRLIGAAGELALKAKQFRLQPRKKAAAPDFLRLPTTALCAAAWSAGKLAMASNRWL